VLDDDDDYVNGHVQKINDGCGACSPPDLGDFEDSANQRCPC
jgi:hypothetical protein